MSKANYHPEAGRSVEFDVAATNKDGTVDLAFEGTVIVSACPVTEEAVIGSCVLIVAEKPAKK